MLYMLVIVVSLGNGSSVTLKYLPRSLDSCLSKLALEAELLAEKDYSINAIGCGLIKPKQEKPNEKGTGATTLSSREAVPTWI